MILPTIWVNTKSLRMNFMMYFMLVIIFPLSYLVIHLNGSASDRVCAVTGMFVSMLLSLFVNMQATLVCNGNTIASLEMCAVYQVKPFWVYFGQCVLHYLLSLVLLAVTLLALVVWGVPIAVGKLLLWLVISFVMLQSFSVMLGSILKNPNIAGPMINLLYMLLVMITPIYIPASAMTQSMKITYGLNPFSHLISLLYWCIGEETIAAPWVSIVYIGVLSLLMELYCYKRWTNAYAVEKLAVF